MNEKVYDYRKKIDHVQKWNNENFSFDPDSSPEAWEHYKKFYIGLDDNLPKLSTQSQYNRLTTFITVKNSKIKVGGDCSFNFNSEKLGEMNDIINNDNNVDKTTKNELIEQLNQCHSMHHTVLNFDLVPVTGGMNNIKGNLKYKNNIVMCHDIGKKPNGGCLDRFDTFIYFLNETFLKIDMFQKSNNLDLKIYGEFFSNSIFTAAMRTENFIELYDFLCEFTDIYDYCDVMYLISDRRFVKEIIASGKEKITSAESLKNYFDLANKYWNIKEEYFENHQKYTDN